jgi:hypothetical protein
VSLLGWLAHLMGLDNLSGPFYGFWSGIGSDLGEVTIIGAALSIWWKHECHVKGCHRMGRHPVAGTPHVVCRRHHPEGEKTHAQILADHAEANK